MIDYFALFNLKKKYFINLEQLEERYFELQMKYHPDRMIGQTEQKKIESLKHSADVNDGYRILGDNVERANHMLALEGISINKEKDNTYQPSQALLVEQMELRERASDIEGGMENKAELLSHVEAEFEGTMRTFDEQIKQKSLEEAAQSAIKLKYLEKLAEELEKIKD